jgi:predicted TIM-barrel fold metal-dependent hydrolase
MRFDVHTHIFAPAQRERRTELCERDGTFGEMYGDPSAKIATSPDLLAAMDAASIDRAAAAGFAFAEEAEIERQTEALLEAARGAAGRIVPLVPVNPTRAGWEQHAERAAALGARGFGELRPANQRWDPLAAEGHTLCELAEALGVPLLWHVSEPVGHGYPGKAGGITAAELCRLAEAHPRTKMIAAHLGGGLSFYLQMPEVRAALANVYFDTAAASLLYDDGSVARLVGLAGAGRVMFGSDYPLLSPRRQVERLLASLSPDDLEAVLGATAETLFSDSTSQ